MRPHGTDKLPSVLVGCHVRPLCGKLGFEGAGWMVQNLGRSCLLNTVGRKDPELDFRLCSAFL